MSDVEKEEHREKASRAAKKWWKKAEKRRERKAKRLGVPIESLSLRPNKIKYEQDPQRYATGAQRVRILRRDGSQCRYCGNLVTNESANMDHVDPWKYGGRTIIKNLVTCCRDCNAAKGNKRGWEPKPEAR